MVPNSNDNQIDNGFSKLCWESCQKIAIYFHMWWECDIYTTWDITIKDKLRCNIKVKKGITIKAVLADI